MKRKNFFVTILALSAMVMSMTSCGTILPSAAYYTGSGTLNGVVADYLISATGQRGGVIEDRINSMAGHWYENGASISATATPNWYSVTRDGVTEKMYLMPFNEALRKLPAGTRVFSFKAADNSIGWNTMYKVLTWRIATNKGEARVSEYGAFIRKY